MNCFRGRVTWFLALAMAGLAATPGNTQNIRREYWLGIPDPQLSTLKSSPGYPENFSGVDFPTLFEGPSNWADNYGTRLRGYVLPPVTGNYVFWISGDDQCELYLSTDEHPVSKQLIATVASWTGSREWLKEPNQQSVPIQLEGGRRYYIEALHKEGEGGDNVAVGWQLPNGVQERPIPGHRLEPYLLSTNPPTLIDPPDDVTVVEGEYAEFRVVVTGAEPMTLQWQRNGVDLTGAFFPNLKLGPVTLDDDGMLLRCRITNPRGTIWTDTVTLRVLTEQNPPVTQRLTPPAGAVVRKLTGIEVHFNEAVQGVDAADLLINGQHATGVSGFGAGPYQFVFATPAAGTVTFAWAPGHGITDRAVIPNAFAGGQWTLTLDPNATLPDVVINEFLASNLSGLADEEGQQQDWIELRNRGVTPARLDGWTLTDDPKFPDQWVLPDVTLPPGGFLVVYASAKDRRDPAQPLHTNFKLSRTGEFLGLFAPELPRVAVDSLTPSYPDQRGDYSFGRDAAGEWRYFAVPTPGGPNGASTITGVTPAPHFSAQRGFYLANPFNLHLSADPGAVIRYTTNGSEPTLASAVYSGPIPITRSTPVRAVAFQTNCLPSEPVTHTFLVGLPAAFRSLPALSLVTDQSHLWGPSGIMEVNPRNTIYRGIAWERPVSAELVRPEDNDGFQIDCGIRLQGGDYVRSQYDPNASLPFSKYSYRLYFRGEYGAGQLEYPLIPGAPVSVFDQIALRAGMNDHSNPFIVDELCRRLFAGTGHVSSRGTFANLFLNGAYRGYYNPTERIDEDFLRRRHGGTNDWDLIAQGGEIQAGDGIKWNELVGFVTGADLSAPGVYENTAALIDLDNFIDYLLVNMYGATGDWPHNNWRAARPRQAGGRFQFLIWDAEWAFGHADRAVTHNTITTELAEGSEIARMFRSLASNPEFRLHFADRVHRHFFNDGALTDAAIASEYWKLRQEVAGVLANMTDRIHQTWIPQRRGILFDQLRVAGLFASDHAPVFSRQGGRAATGDQLGMSTSRGVIHFTLDGTDPRRPATGVAQEFAWIPATASKRVLVPDVANGGSALGDAWKGGAEPFAASGWRSGTGGVGYDTEPTYRPLIQIDVGPEMQSRAGTAFIRIPFHVNAADLDLVDQLLLRVQYDDGFVAWLNREPIASANAPLNPAWDAFATLSNPDTAATNFQSFNVTAHLGRLRSGTNVLAIQGLNVSTGSSDFLINAELIGRDSALPGVNPSATPYSAPITLSQSVTVKARALDGEEWSALTEATFTIDDFGLPLRFTEIMFNPAGGRAYQFLELHNAGFAALNLSGCSFQGIQWTFPNGSILPGGQTWILASAVDPAAFALRYPGVTVEGWYGGNLSSNGERIALLDPSGNVLLAVQYKNGSGWPVEPENGGHSLELVELQGDPNAPGSWRLSTLAGGTPGAVAVPPPPPAVRLNELMAQNLTAVPVSGTYPDWVELFNAGAGPVNLGGWSLTDSADPRRFVFPTGTQLASGAYLIVWCDSNFAAPGLHAGFALDRDGENIRLFNAQTNLVDAVSFGRQLSDFTLGRIVGAGDVWQLNVPTPNATNVAAARAAPSNLVINEWMPNPASGEFSWLELYNTHPTLPVSLQGLFVGHSNVQHRLASRSYLESGGFLRLFTEPGGGNDRIEFRFQPAGGQIELFDATGEKVHTLIYGPQPVGVSAGRFPDAASNIVAFPGSPSPGASNFVLTWTGPVLNEFLAVNRGVVTMNSGLAADWIEIHHPGTTAFDLGGMSLSIGSRGPGQWRFPNGTMLNPGGHLVIWCDPGQPPSTNVVAELNTGRGLSGDGEAIFLFDSGGYLVDSVEFGFQIRDQSVGRKDGLWRLLASPTPGATNATPAQLGGPSELRFNEWLANPVRGDDFIELYNRSLQPVDLSGLFLTDDPSIAGQTRFKIRPLSFIAPRGWVTFSADDGNGPDSLNFGLSGDGEHLRLYSTDRATLDAIDFGLQAPGVSRGRLPDGQGSLVSFVTTQSPNESNYLPVDGVVINEVLGHSPAPFEAAIELYNPTASAVDLSGWYVSDSESDLRKYRIPAGTVILPGAFRVFYEYQFNGQPPPSNPLNLAPASGATIYLSQANIVDNLTGFRAQVKFGPSFQGVSFGRHVTSVGADFVPLLHPTFGISSPGSTVQFRSGVGATNAGPVVGPLVINEIMAVPPDLGDFDPSDAAFLEVKNIGNDLLPLFDPARPTNTWRVRDGITFDFPADVTLEPGEQVALVGFSPVSNAVKSAAFLSRYGLSSAVRLFGPYSGQLATQGEPVELLRPAPPEMSGPDIGRVPYVLVERIHYAHTTPWPWSGIGQGASLQRIDPLAYGNEPLNWDTAFPTPGTWNAVVLTDSDGDGMPDFWERNHGLDPSNPGDALQDADGDGVNNRDEYRAGTSARDAERRLQVREVTADHDGVWITFDAEPGRVYTVEFLDGLGKSFWQPLHQIDPAYHRRVVQWRDASGPTAMQRYYRIVAAVPE